VAAAQGSVAGQPGLRHPRLSRAGAPPEPALHFVGREAELTQLGRQLRQSRRVVIHGLGGVGKTQLAVQFLHRHLAEYPDGAFWLHADREGGLVADLAGLVWPLELPEREASEQEEQVEAVVRWLHDRGRWLLVLDNLEPVAHGAVRRWLGAGLAGHLLATSRTPAWPAHLILRPL